MRAVVYTAPRKFEVRELPEPAPGPGEVVVSVSATGICGTDLHIHDGGFFSSWPLTPGHEIYGTVASVGDGVDNLSPGQRVVVDNASVCAACPECMRGDALFCRNFRSLGVNAPGGFAEKVLATASHTYPVALDPDLAVLAEPLACVVHGMDVLALKTGADVLLLGAGTTGLLLAQMLLHGGAGRVTVAAPTVSKLEVAQRLGVDQAVQIQRGAVENTHQQLHALNTGGFDVTIDATGHAPLVEVLPLLTRTGGTVFVYGMCDERALVHWSPYEIFRRQLTVKGSFAQVHCFGRALALLDSGRIRADGIITHRFALDEYPAALETVGSNPACLKAIVEPRRRAP